MHAIHVIYVLFLCLFDACTGIGTVGYVPTSCLRSVHAIVDERQAILRARTAWYCIHPYEAQTSEQDWLKNFEAARRGRDWKVGPVLPPGYAGGGINVLLAADGRVLDVFMTG